MSRPSALAAGASRTGALTGEAPGAAVMASKFDTLDELKAGIAKLWEDGKKIQSHYRRLEKEYDDWQDRLIEIENIIAKTENETGLSKEEITKPNSILDDIFGDDLNV